MFDQPFDFSYKLPDEPIEYLDGHWEQGEWVSVVSPEHKKPYLLHDTAQYKGRVLFDGTSFEDFEKYIDMYQFCGADEFEGFGKYYSQPDKEWERINTFWFFYLRLHDVGHKGFYHSKPSMLNAEKWIKYITLFLKEFPDNPRVYLDYIDYLRMIGEHVKSFEMAVKHFEKYPTFDVYHVLRVCLYYVNHIFNGKPSWHKED